MNYTLAWGFNGRNHIKEVDEKGLRWWLNYINKTQQKLDTPLDFIMVVPKIGD